MTTISLKALRRLPAMQMEKVKERRGEFDDTLSWVMAKVRNALREQILSELTKTHTTHVSNIDTLNMSKAKLLVKRK